MDNIENAPKLMKTRELAGYLGMHPNHVRLLALDKKIPSEKIGGSYRYVLKEVLASLTKD